MTRLRRAARWLLPVCALALSGSGLAAQADDGRRSETGSRWASYGAALGLGALGFVAGGYAAGEASASGNACEDLSCLEAAFYGAAAIGTAGVAIGAHLGNGRRGSLGLDLGTAAAIWLLGIGPVILARDIENAYAVAAFIAVPIAQVIVTTEVERARGRARVRAAAVSVLPVWRRDGRGLAVQLRF